MYINSLLKKFKKSDLYLENFPHIIIENALDEEFYNKLAADFPTQESFTDNPNIGQNIRLNIPYENYTGTSPAWKEFLEYHSSFEFFNSIISTFNSEIQNSNNQNLLNLISKNDLKTGFKKKDYDTKKIDIWHDISISINTKLSGWKPSVRVPHLDKPDKIYGGLFYMRNPKDKCTGGNLELYKFINKKKYMRNDVPPRFVQKFSQVNYKENTLVIFLNTNDSVHGVTPRTATEYPRRFLYFHATANNIKMHDASLNQVSNIENFLVTNFNKVRDKISTFV